MIIFSPGPANISERVRKSLLSPDICHRDTEFEALFNETKQLLLKATTTAGYKPAIFTGSGTAAIVASIASLRNLNRKLLVVSNGIYGERAYDIAKNYKLKVKKIAFPVNRLPDLNKIENAIKSYKPDSLYVVHHETTTGLLNPLKEMSLLAKKYKLTLIVDAVSSIASDKLEAKKWGIGILIGSANKCIRATAGLSFSLVSPSIFKELASSTKKQSAYYLDLPKHLKMAEFNQTPFTPAVHNFYALREALKELLEEGVNNRINHYRGISQLLRNNLRDRGFKILIDDKISSNTMTTILLPKNIKYSWLHEKCKEKGFCIYACMGGLKDKAFRLGVVGVITKNDIKRFFTVLDKALKDKRQL